MLEGLEQGLQERREFVDLAVVDYLNPHTDYES